MAKKSKAAASKSKSPKRVVPGKGNLRSRALGEAVDAFGQEIVPLGPRAGVLANRVGNHLLTMLEGSVFGLEKVGEWLKNKVGEKLKDVSEEKIVPPDPRIAVPAVQALVYSMGEDHIRDMFANLLASNMNAETKEGAHPAFVEMIKEMTPLEARVIKTIGSQNQLMYRVRYKGGTKWNEVTELFSFADTEVNDVSRVHTAIDNLIRLRLVEPRPNEWPIIAGITDGQNPDPIVEKINAQFKPAIEAMKNSPEALSIIGLGDDLHLDIYKIGLFITPLGRGFLRACTRSEPAPAAQES